MMKQLNNSGQARRNKSLTILAKRVDLKRTGMVNCQEIPNS